MGGGGDFGVLPQIKQTSCPCSILSVIRMEYMYICSPSKRYTANDRMTTTINTILELRDDEYWLLLEWNEAESVPWVHAHCSFWLHLIIEPRGWILTLTNLSYLVWEITWIQVWFGNNYCMSKVSAILPIASAIIPKLHSNPCDSMLKSVQLQKMWLWK